MNKIKLNDYKICHKCGGKMTSGTVNESIKVDKKEIILKGLNGYCCGVCGEIIFSAEELKKSIRSLGLSFRPMNCSLFFLSTTSRTKKEKKITQIKYDIRDGTIPQMSRSWRD